MRAGPVAARLLLVALVACREDAPAPAPAVSAQDRATAEQAATQCADTAATLGSTFDASLRPRLVTAFGRDAAEAQRLLRDSLELMITTRELLCNQNAGIVDAIIAKAPGDAALSAHRARINAASTKLTAARKAYDELLGAATANMAPTDHAALVERFSQALLAK